ncbi:MAG: hypothetical protein EOP83_02745 [Verrucomicrobiaceae bacterium]|nr:MAG: hypothetical protein EOP83_02745 [Verrucomicrobiaceae bacterium]
MALINKARPRRPSTKFFNLTEEIDRAPRWFMRADFERIHVWGPPNLTTVTLYRRQDTGVVVEEFAEIIAWSHEQTEGLIVYESRDHNAYTQNGAISYFPQGSTEMVTKLREIRVGVYHDFSFTDPNEAFAFKMRWT